MTIYLPNRKPTAALLAIYVSLDGVFTLLNSLFSVLMSNISERQSLYEDISTLIVSPPKITNYLREYIDKC